MMKSISFSLLDVLYLVFTSIITVFYLSTLPSNPYALGAGVSLLAVFVLIVTVAYFRSRKKGRWLIFWYPLIYLLGIFETFFMILPYFNSKRYDQALTDIDFSLFGVNPTVWIEQFHDPMLTDLLYLLYFFYFPMQAFILIYLYRKRMFEEMEKAVFILMVCNFAAYISYFYFPAVGPRFYLDSLQSIRLDGIVLAKPIKAIIGFMEPNKLDAFPSLHTAILITSLLLMHKYNKKMFAFIMLPGLGILISLVYCRYHYVIDMIVGAVWALICYYGSGWIFDKYKHHFLRSFY